jgi:hypothetical protein
VSTTGTQGVGFGTRSAVPIPEAPRSTRSTYAGQLALGGLAVRPNNPTMKAGGSRFSSTDEIEVSAGWVVTWTLCCSSRLVNCGSCSPWVAGGEARAVAELSGDAAVRADRNGSDLSGSDVALELGVADLLDLRAPRQQDSSSPATSSQFRHLGGAGGAGSASRSRGGPDAAQSGVRRSLGHPRIVIIRFLRA